MLRKGSIIDNKYEILKKIGQGGMSRVWLAMDTHVNKQWAVKEIDKKSDDYRKSVDEQKTLREASLMKKLDHPALPRIVDIIDKGDYLYVIMDYIEGESLLDLLNTHGIPEQETVVSWMLDVCDALNYMHHCDPPIIYRDMKPSNIMLTRDQRIKIIDFGIAREYKGGKEDTMPLGTLGYASPEHFTKHTDVRSDVYTVGATMYQLLTGKDPTEPPHYLRPIREIDPKLSSGLEKIIIKATQADPDSRYQTIAELSNALESYRSLEQEHIDALEAKERTYRRGLAAGIALAVIGLMLFVAGLFIEGHTYSQLIATTPGSPQAVENYEKAVQMEPGRPEAYERLLSEYTKDGKLTDDELGSFMTVFNGGRTQLARNEKDYVSISYDVGEAILTYYAGKSDSSSRARLLQAEPFFSEVTSGDTASLASSYVFLAEFYRNYIMADSSLVVKGATKETYTEFLDSCRSSVEALDGSEYAGREKMKAITYDCILSAISLQASSMSETGISRASAEDLVTMISKDPDLTDECKKLASDAKESLDRAYSTKKGGRS